MSVSIIMCKQTNQIITSTNKNKCEKLGKKWTGMTTLCTKLLINQWIYSIIIYESITITGY